MAGLGRTELAPGARAGALRRDGARTIWRADPLTVGSLSVARLEASHRDAALPALGLPTASMTFYAVL